MRQQGCRQCEQITSGDCGQHGPLFIPTSDGPKMSEPQYVEGMRAEVARLRVENVILQRRVGALVKALDRCESSRGAFSCHEPHDLRCPKSRAESPEKWRGEWKCECGREQLDEALAASRGGVGDRGRAR